MWESLERDSAKLPVLKMPVEGLGKWRNALFDECLFASVGTGQSLAEQVASLIRDENGDGLFVVVWRTGLWEPPHQGHFSRGFDIISAP